MKKWIFWIDSGLTNLRQHFDIFLNECLFLTQENEHNMNIGEHESNKLASTFVREFILVYFFKSLLN